MKRKLLRYIQEIINEYESINNNIALLIILRILKESQEMKKAFLLLHYLEFNYEILFPKSRFSYYKKLRNKERRFFYHITNLKYKDFCNRSDFTFEFCCYRYSNKFSWEIYIETILLFLLVASVINP